MDSPKSIYKSFFSTENLNSLSIKEALRFIERFVDLSGDLEEIDGLRHAIYLSEELRKRNLNAEELALAHYYSANAWTSLKVILKRGTTESWDWEQEEIEHEIIHLRSALQQALLCNLPDERMGQILTNLGNLMSNTGRFVEAIEYWERALSILPSFGMARGNRGYGLNSYASVLYDQNHRALFLKNAYLELKKALIEPLYEDARTSFKKCISNIENTLHPEYLAKDVDMHNFSLGASKQEIKYRRWCLENRLFLNPLNDLGPYPIASQDILTIPSIVVNISEGPYYSGFFNQLKQEFTSARFLYYEGVHSEQPHFSDKKVLLYNTFDYPSYSLANEKRKAAYRMFYSLFDKFAFFLNSYFGLSIPERMITFKTFWYVDQKRKKGLRPDFQQRQNWPLRGLFWLSKDLYEDKREFKESIEPDAKELYDIRNHLEHKYLKLHDDLWDGPSLKNERVLDGLVDKLAFSMYRREFEEKTLRLLKMTRASLIYLSLAIHCEERHRSKKRGSDKIIPQMPLDTWDDMWKV